ncbi:V4R domain-containing protein [Aquifex sp.]
MAGLIEAISQVNRPKLGKEVPIVVFRAFRLFTEFSLEEIVGSKGTITLLQSAGKELGKEMAKGFKKDNLEEFLESSAQYLYDERIGILIPVEITDNYMVLRLDECITCAGMPNIGKRICHFEVGLAAGLAESFLNKRVKAYETKCNANGEGTCEVRVEF